MPVLFGTEISTVSFDNKTGIITISGEAFGEEQTNACDIECSLHGSGIWFDALLGSITITAWNDTFYSGIINDAPLDPGSYDVRVTSADRETSPIKENAFTVNNNIALFFFFQK